MQGTPGADDGICGNCGSALRFNAPFCGTCGQAVAIRGYQPPTPTPGPQPAPPSVAPMPSAGVTGARRGVRCACHLLDLAVMLSPALPLAIAAAFLGAAEIVYTVVPVAFVAVWVWMQIWQGYTGQTFGKSMLGLRLVRAGDNRPPGVARCLLRGAVFAATAGLAGVPVIIDDTPTDGLHDKISGLTAIDVVEGVNPLGRQQNPVFRRAAGRGLNKVASPLPTSAPGRR